MCFPATILIVNLLYRFFVYCVLLVQAKIFDLTLDPNMVFQVLVFGDDSGLELPPDNDALIRVLKVHKLSRLGGWRRHIPR